MAKLKKNLSLNLNKIVKMKIKLFLALIIAILSLNFKAHAAGDAATAALKPQQISWQFDGLFGKFDYRSIQRGFQVYREVCSSCHSLKLASYRNLQQVGFSEDEVKQIAAEYLVKDGPDDNGEIFLRPGLPSDRFVSPYANENAARLANGGAYPPDLSLIVKARMDGANYLYSLLTGYEKAPDDFNLTEGKYYNPYFEGRQIAMPSPIGDDELVEYQDGLLATKEQMTYDVVNFLQFVAEPEMEQRKSIGIKTLIFLAILIVLFALAKRQVWKSVK